MSFLLTTLIPLLGLVLTAAVAWLLGAMTVRLSGHYLPLATIAWGLSLYFLFGNLLGIYCLQLSFLYTDAGVAAILIAMQPIFIIPIVAVMERRLPSLRMVLGTLISFAGVALVCLR